MPPRVGKGAGHKTYTRYQVHTVAHGLCVGDGDGFGIGVEVVGVLIVVASALDFKILSVVPLVIAQKRHNNHNNHNNLTSSKKISQCITRSQLTLLSFCYHQFQFPAPYTPHYLLNLAPGDSPGKPRKHVPSVQNWGSKC